MNKEAVKQMGQATQTTYKVDGTNIEGSITQHEKYCEWRLFTVSGVGEAHVEFPAIDLRAESPDFEEAYEDMCRVVLAYVDQPDTDDSIDLKGLTKFQIEVHDNSKAKGFWSSSNWAEKIALIHSEVSELLEEFRKEIPEQSEKCPGFSKEEEEAADVLIRLLDLAEARGWRLGEAALAKHAYNKTRPTKHGKRF